MDGIFGVGLAEVIIIGLVLFIIGGPENTAKWARELGRMTRKARQAWADMMSEFEKDLGPEGKEILDATRELSQNVNDLRRMSSPRGMVTDSARLVNKTLSEVEKSVTIEPVSDKPAAPESSSDPSEEKVYPAWLPPQSD